MYTLKSQWIYYLPSMLTSFFVSDILHFSDYHNTSSSVPVLLTADVNGEIVLP
jgi:hypothetical protein